jgi:hypothetical protein
MKNLLFILSIFLISISSQAQSFTGYWNIIREGNATERMHIQEDKTIIDISGNTENKQMKLQGGAYFEMMGYFSLGIGFNSPHKCRYQFYGNNKLQIVGDEDYYYLNITLIRMSDSEADEFESDLKLIYAKGVVTAGGTVYNGTSYSAPTAYPTTNTNTYSCTTVNQMIKMYEDRISDNEKRILMYEGFNRPDMYSNNINQLTTQNATYSNEKYTWECRLAGCKY